MSHELVGLEWVSEYLGSWKEKKNAWMFVTLKMASLQKYPSENVISTVELQNDVLNI